MDEFYRAVHEIVGELTEARNIFIALYDEERRLISWPYFVDAEDPEAPDHSPDPRQWFAFGEGEARGVTAYVLRTDKPLRLPAERMMELVEQGEVELIGTVTE